MSNHYSKPSKFIFHYLSHYKAALFIGLVCVCFTVFFQLYGPWILRYAIDYIEGAPGATDNLIYKALSTKLAGSGDVDKIDMILGYSILIVVVTILGGTFRFLMRYILIGASRKIEVEIRNDYFGHLLKLPPSFYDRQQTGDLMARGTNDLDAVRSMLGPGIMHLFSTVLVAAFAVVLMLKISPRLTLWAIVPLPFVAIIVNRLLAKIHKLFGKIQEQFSAVTSKVEENLTGIRVIKSYVREENEITQFNELNRELVNRNLSLAKIRALLRTNIEFILGLGIIIVIWVGGILVIEQKLTIGGLIAFITYFTMLAWPMIALGWVLNLWQQGLASLKRMLMIWGHQAEESELPQGSETRTSLSGEIEFRDMTFSYEEGPVVLEKINLKIDAGETVAIVGGTGSGKSTLVHLIAGLYPAPAGTLLIDGRPIETFSKLQLRDEIGFVQQETFLFSDTLRENIRFGNLEARDEDIEEAADISRLALDMDQMPEGFETLVGERGITLSGGQKQRTSIARAVIRKPRILILDDALSAVDTYTEEAILQKLREIMKERTSIIVSHRISTIRDADQIVVLEEGKIVEKGSHVELVAAGGVYSKMYQRQQLESSLEEID